MEQSNRQARVISPWHPAIWIVLHFADVGSTLFALSAGATQEANPLANAIGIWPFFIVKCLAACFTIPVFYRAGWQKWFPFMNGVMIGIIGLNMFWAFMA